MRGDLGWVCDELAKLHRDLEAIRAGDVAQLQPGIISVEIMPPAGDGDGQPQLDDLGFAQ